MTRLETMLALVVGLLAGVIIGWLGANKVMAAQVKQAQRAQGMEEFR